MHYGGAFYVYTMTNRMYGTLYVGVTNDLGRRVWEHREGLVDGFTKKYGLKLLVYYERFRSHRRRYPSRETAEALESRVEDCARRKAELELGRP